MRRPPSFIPTSPLHSAFDHAVKRERRCRSTGPTAVELDARACSSPGVLNGDRRPCLDLFTGSDDVISDLEFCGNLDSGQFGGAPIRHSLFDRRINLRVAGQSLVSGVLIRCRLLGITLGSTVGLGVIA